MPSILLEKIYINNGFLFSVVNLNWLRRGNFYLSGMRCSFFKMDCSRTDIWHLSSSERVLDYFLTNYEANLATWLFSYPHDVLWSVFLFFFAKRAISVFEPNIIDHVHNNKCFGGSVHLFYNAPRFLSDQNVKMI